MRTGQVHHTQKDQMFLIMLISQLLFQPQGKPLEASCKITWFTSVKRLCSLAWLFFLRHLSFSSGFVPCVLCSTCHLHDCLLEKSFIFLFWVIFGLLNTHGANYSLVFLFQILSGSVFINLYPVSKQIWSFYTHTTCITKLFT